MASEIRVNQIQNRSGLGTVTFTDTGAVLSGIVTVSGNLKGPSEVDAITVNATTVTGTTVNATTIKVGTAVTISAGVVTATSFSGDGSGLSGIDASSLKSGGVVKVQANSSGAVISGVATATQITVGNAFIKDSAVGLGTTTSAGRNAGVGTMTGTLIYLPDSGIQIYTGDAAGWKSVADTDESRGATVTGGTITSVGNDRIHTFTSNDDFVTSKALVSVSLLVVAGGGGAGGSTYGAGGGAGGVSHVLFPSPVPATTHAVVVGPGGNAGATNVQGAAGSDSSFSAPGTSTYRIAKGGSGGGCYSAPSAGYTSGPGGSTGGASSRPNRNAGPAIQPAQNSAVPGTDNGNRGGNYTTPLGGYAARGGGGAGAQGFDGADIPGGGNGGDGIEYGTSGSPVYYAGGGAGGIYLSAGTPDNVGRGGNGGGGNAASAQNSTSGSSANQNGTANLGGGGGGYHAPTAGSHNPGPGNGGSGVVIVSYPTVDNAIAT